MDRRKLIEIAVDGVVVMAAGWLIFGPPLYHDTVPPLASGAEGATQAVQELRGPGKGATQQRALALNQPDPESDGEKPDGNTSSAIDPQRNLLVVTATRLNMRAEPHTGAELLASYPRGELVEKITTRGNWVLVRVVDDQTTGWMYGGYLGDAAEN